MDNLDNKNPFQNAENLTVYQKTVVTLTVTRTKEREEFDKIEIGSWLDSQYEVTKSFSFFTEEAGMWLKLNENGMNDSFRKLFQNIWSYKKIPIRKNDITNLMGN